MPDPEATSLATALEELGAPANRALAASWIEHHCHRTCEASRVAAPRLAAWLVTGDAEVRSAARALLKVIGADGIAPFQALTEHPSPWARFVGYEGLDAIRRAQEEAALPPNPTPLRRGVGDWRLPIVLHALEASLEGDSCGDVSEERLLEDVLCRGVAAREAIPLLRRVLEQRRDEAESSRTLAALSLCVLEPSNPPLEALAEELGTYPGGVWAAQALAAHAERAAFAPPRLPEVLSRQARAEGATAHQDEALRAACAETLRGLGVPAEVPHERLRIDPEVRVQRLVCQAVVVEDALWTWVERCGPAAEENEVLLVHWRPARLDDLEAAKRLSAATRFPSRWETVEQVRATPPEPGDWVAGWAPNWNQWELVSAEGRLALLDGQASDDLLTVDLDRAAVMPHAEAIEVAALLIESLYPPDEREGVLARFDIRPRSTAGALPGVGCVRPEPPPPRPWREIGEAKLGCPVEEVVRFELDRAAKLALGRELDSLGPDAEHVEELGVLLKRCSATSEACEPIRELALLDQARYLFALACYERRQGQPALARATFSRVLALEEGGGESPEGRARSHLRIAICAVEEGDREGWVAHLEAARGLLEAETEIAISLFQLGRSLALAGHEQADALLRAGVRAVAGAGGSERTLLELEEIAASLGAPPHPDSRAEPRERPADEAVQPPDEIQVQQVDELDLSTRTRQCLKKLEIKSIGQLLDRTEDDLLSAKNFGLTSLLEIKQELEKRGLRLRDA